MVHKCLLSVLKTIVTNFLGFIISFSFSDEGYLALVGGAVC